MCTPFAEFVEDMKQQDEQTGGFMGDPSSQSAVMAKRAQAIPKRTVQAASGRSGRTILAQIADKVEQKSKNVRVVFRNFDEDKSGSVDYTEFRRGLAHLGIAMSDADFEALIDVVDNDRSGCIDYNGAWRGALSVAYRCYVE